MTIKRNTTATSATGATKFVYAVVATQVLCTIQNSSGRLRQDDLGQIGGRKKTAVFGPEADLQQNDLVVVEKVGGLTFRIVNLHQAVALSGSAVHHQEAQIEQWVPAGDD